MKRLAIHVWVVILATVLIACQSEEPISFSDEQLESAIRAEIDKPEGDLYEVDINEIIELDLSGVGISELGGIDSLEALEVLLLQDNEIHDFSLLEELDNLQQVNVAGNPFNEDVNQLTLLDELQQHDIDVITQTDEVEVIGRPDGPGGFLWKVENENTTVFLQGTVHAGTEDFYPLHEKIEQAYEEADVIVPEIDMASLNPTEVQQVTMELGVYNDGTTIKDHIPEDLYVGLSATIEELGMQIQMVEQFKPWMLASLIQELMTDQLGYIHGVDNYFLTRAAEDGKEVIGLETVEDQLRIFADTSPEFQLNMLEESLIDIEDYKKEMQELFSMYKEGNPDEMLALLTEGEASEVNTEDQAFMEALNDDRNYGMAETIIDFLEDDQEETYFVIVGSLHLIMEPHIISILEEEGYEVEHIH
ncbi:TraB/GumN family protein [Virgibacillus byunsanensis]|uniref:TraB/GumN family protein n=1 Tax=Virgibacillus byunsanensis TaxID=570945 RepID=A0ABW3LPP8_9BACI